MKEKKGVVLYSLMVLLVVVSAGCQLTRQVHWSDVDGNKTYDAFTEIKKDK